VYAKDCIYCNINQDSFCINVGELGCEEVFYVPRPAFSYLHIFVEDQLKNRIPHGDLMMYAIRYFLDNHMKNLETQEVIYTRPYECS